MVYVKKISVCMAVYNGERFIHEQLNSILPQLRPNDEVIIIDDASSDSTVEIIRNYGDARIKISENTTNLGVIKSVEMALGKASGDYIFMADQDDIWVEDKIARTLIQFNKGLKILVVVSNAYLIDDDKGKKRKETFFELRNSGSGVLKNIYKNTYIGCCMALRKDLLKYILPFPDKMDMHDSWIGLVAETYGQTLFLDECLIYYRMHGNNQRGLVSKKKMIQRITDRWSLSCGLLKRRLNKQP